MQTWLIVLIVIASLIVLFIAVFVFMNIFLFIFAWRNAKLSIKPRVLTLEREVENNKKGSSGSITILMTRRIMRSRARTAMFFMRLSLIMKLSAAAAST